MRKLELTGNEQPLELLRLTLPPLWSIESENGEVAVRAGGMTATFKLIVKSRIEPKDVEPLLWSAVRGKPIGQHLKLLLSAPFLSPRTQELLKFHGANFLDSTGNIYMKSDSPPIFIERSGSLKNPFTETRPLAKLKGGTTSRIVREIIASRVPLSIQDLALRSRTSPAQASRVAQFLNNEAMIQRDKRGQITQIDWEDVLRRWTDDYKFFETNKVVTYLAPRGIRSVIDHLPKLNTPYAISGEQAVRALGLTVASQMLSIYVPAIGSVPLELELVPIAKGANVQLAIAFDSGLFDERWLQDGVYYAPLTQVAADLLTGRDRSSSEAEFLLEWMISRESSWKH